MSRVIDALMGAVEILALVALCALLLSLIALLARMVVGMLLKGE